MNAYTGSVPDTRRRKPDWRTFAACRADDIHPDAMFPDSDKQRTAEARAICAACPVSRTCLRDAINSGDNQHGIRGGLTPEERRTVKKELNRRRKAAEAQQANEQKTAPAADGADALELPQPKKERTLRTIFADNTTPLADGHLAWTGRPQTHFQGQVYTPKQVSFAATRGHRSAGRLRAGCGIDDCVLPAHLIEVPAVAECGSRSGYQKHLREKTVICRPCRQAHADADARLRRTGTTKAAA